MSHDEPYDIYDYTMSNTFVSETRSRPYRTGFRRRHHPRRPSIKYLLSLPDQEFDKYLKNGCRMPDADTDTVNLVTELRFELIHLRSEVTELKSMLRRNANALPLRGGLDVPPRA